MSDNKDALIQTLDYFKEQIDEQFNDIEIAIIKALTEEWEKKQLEVTNKQWKRNRDIIQQFTDTTTKFKSKVNNTCDQYRRVDSIDMESVGAYSQYSVKESKPSMRSLLSERMGSAESTSSSIYRP